jgi:defect-in-organelle-trafficking protein DotC
MQNAWKKLIGLFVICAIIGGCISGQAIESTELNTLNLSVLQGLSQRDFASRGSQISKIRLQALKETAMSIGAQSGLVWRSKQIDRNLIQKDKLLSQIFDFQHLLLDHNVLPPVIQKSSQSLTLETAETIHIADVTYKILKPAKFVTTAPIWRDYLLFNYAKPSLPDKTLLPRDQKERELWMQAVTLAWNKGIAQAETIYADKLSRLNRDYRGMVLYRKLLAQNMVTKPFVAKTHLGVISNTDHTEMRLNERLLRITAVPQLNANSHQWKPAMVMDQP